MSELPSAVAWPDGRRFAFTIFDDTDRTTVVNGPPVYDVLTDLGMYVTKSVWPVAPAGPPTTGGQTCADPGYRAWAIRLQDEGHEIGFHNASDHPSRREETIKALDEFRSIFGHDPRIGADHSHNREALYWVEARLSGARRTMYRRFRAVTNPGFPSLEGHVPTSPYFWGDVSRDRVTYWRSFTFRRTNLLGPTPLLPYHDPARHYVNYWFTSTHAPTLEPFLDLLRPDRLDQLEEEGGVCIVYSHLGHDFAPGGRLDHRFVRAMEALAARPGWFAPTAEVLDHLRAQHLTSLLTDRQRARMERTWIADQVRTRGVSEAKRVISTHRAKRS